MPTVTRDADTLDRIPYGGCQSVVKGPPDFNVMLDMPPQPPLMCCQVDLAKRFFTERLKFPSPIPSVDSVQMKGSRQ